MKRNTLCKTQTNAAHSRQVGALNNAAEMLAAPTQRRAVVSSPQNRLRGGSHILAMAQLDQIPGQGREKGGDVLLGVVAGSSVISWKSEFRSSVSRWAHLLPGGACAGCRPAGGG